jgi:hypothetical protein
MRWPATVVAVEVVAGEVDADAAAAAAAVAVVEVEEVSFPCLVAPEFFN